MSLTLDSQTEQRIHEAAAQGGYNSPLELLRHALDLLDEEEESLANTREALHARMKLGSLELERGDGIAGEEIEAILAERKAKRVA